MYLLYGLIFVAAVFSGIFFIIKGNSMKSFYLICSGVNLIFIPFSFFIGVFETNAPDSDKFDYYKGFLFVQVIPLVLLLISILRIVFIKRKARLPNVKNYT